MKLNYEWKYQMKEQNNKNIEKKNKSIALCIFAMRGNQARKLFN